MRRVDIALIVGRRKWLILSLVMVTLLGFGFKYYKGVGSWWFNDYGAGVMYEIFWCLVVYLIRFRRQDATRIAFAVLIITCALEVLQLWHGWQLLEDIRGTFPGAVLLGTTFVWWDLPHYALGCAIGWVWMRLIGND